jgi:hypothetical protein
VTNGAGLTPEGIAHAVSLTTDCLIVTPSQFHALRFARQVGNDGVCLKTRPAVRLARSFWSKNVLESDMSDQSDFDDLIPVQLRARARGHPRAAEIQVSPNWGNSAAGDRE